MILNACQKSSKIQVFIDNILVFIYRSLQFNFMLWNMLSATCDFAFHVDLISRDYQREKKNNMLMYVLKANVTEIYCKVYM